MTAAPPRPRPQISLALLLMLMCIFVLMSAGMYYASRVAAVQDEIAVLTGVGGSGDASRTAHLTFLIFTYTSPLLLAAVVGIMTVVMRYRERQGGAKLVRRDLSGKAADGA